MNTTATATRTLPASSQRITPEKFAHVVLKTANFDAVIEWFATMDEAHAYLTGPDFAQNPIGVIFDPEQLIRDYEAGLSFDDLVRRPPLPPGKTPMDMRAESPRA